MSTIVIGHPVRSLKTRAEHDKTVTSPRPSMYGTVTYIGVINRAIVCNVYNYSILGWSGWSLPNSNYRDQPSLSDADAEPLR